MALNGIQLKNLIGGATGCNGNIVGQLGSSFCNSIFAKGMGNNPFGSELSCIANGLLNGGNFWDLLGGAAANLGQRVASKVANTIMDAVGGLFGGLLSIAKEKVNAKRKEAEIRKNNEQAQQAAKQGFDLANKTIAQASTQIETYNKEVNVLMDNIKNAQGVSEQLKADFENQALQLKQQMAAYEQKVAEKEALESKIQNTTDEKQKAGLQSQLETLSNTLVGLSTGIASIQSTITTIKTNLEAEVAKANVASAQAIKNQALAQTLADGTQTQVDGVIDNTTASVGNFFAQGANIAAGLKQDSFAYKAKAAVGTVKTILSFGAGAASQGQWLALAATALNGANNGADLLTGTIQGFGSQLLGLQTPVNNFNTGVVGLGSMIDNVVDTNVSFQEQAQQYIESLKPYTQEQKKNIA